MFYRRIALMLSLWFTASLQVQASPDNTALSVWANEAIVATFTYNYQNFLPRQKEIATWFTADGWIRYSKALEDAKLLDTITTNSYFVSAVATLPPEIKMLNEHQWQAVMPVLVLYKNPAYKQKQNLMVTLTFTEVTGGAGVRGLAIVNLQAVTVKPPCKCAMVDKFKAVA